MKWTFAGIISVLLLLSLATFFPSLERGQTAARLWVARRRTRIVKEHDVRVWITTRSGFYYCSDSRAYGKLEPGVYMRQGDALERGYQPFFRKACRELAVPLANIQERSGNEGVEMKDQWLSNLPDGRRVTFTYRAEAPGQNSASAEIEASYIPRARECAWRHEPRSN